MLIFGLEHLIQVKFYFFLFINQSVQYNHSIFFLALIRFQNLLSFLTPTFNIHSIVPFIITVLPKHYNSSPYKLNIHN